MVLYKDLHCHRAGTVAALALHHVHAVLMRTLDIGPRAPIYNRTLPQLWYRLLANIDPVTHSHP